MGPRRFRLAAEDEPEFAASHQLFVGHEAAVERFAIEQNIFHKGVLVVHLLAYDRQQPAVGEMENGPIDKWTPQYILVRSRSDRIKAQGSKDEPCGHLAQIVVAYQAVGRWPVLRVHNLLEPRLRLESRACVH